ncbi:hypothetical protein QN277_011961 [Acacia crassicarpa]|uniref:Phenolic glucoside malonyltransferase 1-like n=1 Tax=Acacia crassicarpa TaxID=499986 RepID=A0AAE1TCX2_9FABA|nr:hypothetical protein QN277_011961 [Acacia crassicarpa]
MAKPASSLKVLEVCRVAPLPEAKPSAPALETSLPLTFFDIIWLRFTPIERLFFYEYAHPPSSFFHSLLPKLKHSLSLTLRHFLPLTGNIIWPPHSPKPFIRYVSGNGVSLTVAESNADFNVLSSSNFSEAEESLRFVPDLTVSDEEASIVSLQITLFPNSGFSIGITAHHATMDGKSSTLFIKAWAYICSKLDEPLSDSSLPENLMPFYDRSVIKDSFGVAEIFSNHWSKLGGPNNRSLKFWNPKKTDQGKRTRGTFEFFPSDIQKLKKIAESKLNNKKIHVSTFSVACAYVLECLVKAEQIKEDNLLFVFAVDCRYRLDPSVPPTYFGSCVGGAKAVTETKNLLGNDGFIAVLEALSDALKRFEDDGLCGAETMMTEMETLMKTNLRLFSTAGSPRFEVYGIDFGCGRPKKVEIVSIGETGALSLSESKNGNGGIEIGLVLNKTEMESFAALFHKGLSSSS